MRQNALTALWREIRGMQNIEMSYRPITLSPYRPIVLFTTIHFNRAPEARVHDVPH